MEGIIISFIIIGIIIILYIVLNLYNDKNKDSEIIIKKVFPELNIKNIYSINKNPFKIFKEEDHVISFLYLKNKDFLSGQMNGMISYYNGKTYHAIILIYEHCEPITSLFQLHDETILTSSADGTMKKIRILLNNNNNKKYLVEFVFYTNKEFIFKCIQLKNNDDILSCNISKELILWKKNKNNDYPLYKVEKILLNNEYIRDILQINENIFITCGESLQCWNINNYELIKKLLYICKGNNSLYKINDEYSGILLQKDGDILLFNNKTLSKTKILNLTTFSLTCIKALSNQIIIIGIFDGKSKRSLISQYILIKKKLNEDKNNEIELINLKTEYIDNNWKRINIIEEKDDKLFLGLGGEKDKKYFGQIIIFEN